MTAPSSQDRLARLFDRRAPGPGASRRAKITALVVVAACHLGLLLLMRGQSPGLEIPTPPAAPVMAEIFDPPKPPPPPPEPHVEDPGAPAPAAAATPAPPTPPTPPSPLPPPRPARVPPPPETPTRPTAPTMVAEPDVVLGASAIAGATVAGSGTGGNGAGGDGSGSGSGACDMVRRLQDALREDADIRGAVTRAHQGIGPGGRAILVWNGEWLRNPGQDGKGLAGVRQAIAMEVAFAPPACKTQVMRGLVLISFNDAPGGPKLALGTREWRWKDLLAARR